MPRHVIDPDTSDLERGIELEMEEGPLEERSEMDEEIDELGDTELEDVEGELEDVEPALDSSGYGERFYELSMRGFETESEVDEAVGGIVDEMEREYFFGAIKRFAKKGLSAGTKALIRRASQLGGGLPALQALKGITQLSRGNLKGMLASLAKAGLSTALRSHPAGAAALSTLGALGFKESADPTEERRAWSNFVDVSHEAYEHLAQNLDARATNPVGAGQLAANALQAAMRKTRVQAPAAPAGRRRRRIRLRRGEILIVEAL